LDQGKSNQDNIETKGMIMKNLMMFILLLFFSFSFSDVMFAQEKTKENKETTSAKTEDGKPVNSICPVSTEDVDGEITHEYKGKTYALCCKSCLKKFKQDPEKYISRLSEDGKSIKKNKGDKK
jgi:YHS domain-containing protein